MTPNSTNVVCVWPKQRIVFIEDFERYTDQYSVAEIRDALRLAKAVEELGVGWSLERTEYGNFYCVCDGVRYDCDRAINALEAAAKARREHDATLPDLLDCKGILKADRQDQNEQ